MCRSISRLAYMHPNRTVHAQNSAVFAQSPANKAPMTPPAGGEAAKRPSNTFLALPGGTMRASTVTAFGMKMPPPTPLKARIAMNASKDLQNPLAREKAAKRKSPMRASRS